MYGFPVLIHGPGGLVSCDASAAGCRIYKKEEYVWLLPLHGRPSLA